MYIKKVNLYMRFFNILIMFFLFIQIPLHAHGNNGDCSNECNNYYCIKKDKEKNNNKSVQN